MKDPRCYVEMSVCLIYISNRILRSPTPFFFAPRSEGYYFSLERELFMRPKLEAGECLATVLLNSVRTAEFTSDGNYWKGKKRTDPYCSIISDFRN